MKEQDYYPISANTLFHFTDNFQNLLNILKIQFRPHYCLEDFRAFYPSLPSSLEIAIPMICFCDIPLSNIKMHIGKYGCFGIGLSKEWGKKYGISPVLYTYPNAILGKSIGQILTIASDSSKEKERLQVRSISDTVLCYIKSYEGYLWRNGKYSEKSVRFYDEREWRFVPDALYVGLPNYLFKRDFLNEKLLNDVNSSLAMHFRLEFQYGDIKYLIVENESYIVPLMNAIQEMRNQFNEEASSLLSTRIITIDHILEDF